MYIYACENVQTHKNMNSLFPSPQNEENLASIHLDPLSHSWRGPVFIVMRFDEYNRGILEAVCLVMLRRRSSAGHVVLVLCGVCIYAHACSL